MAERQFGPYRLVRQIAVGGMAEIHLAKTKGIAGFEKYVALKMIHPNFAEDEQFIQMLVDEAKIAVQLSHGNIAQTFDLGRVGDTYYITMEYVDGADLYKILRRASERDIEMPLDVCAFVAKEVASALDHAHRKRDHTGRLLGIVHRDVSPQNVLVSYAGEVKLVDFGIAKATMKVRQTAVGVIKGKYYYMSPEQAWGDPTDSRSDIFSAGIVLYEMLTGQMLYLEEDLQKLLDMARKANIASPTTLRRQIPPQLERIVMHALAKSPDDRYQTAGDLASDLERFLHTYSPVFTATKLASLIKLVVGEPTQVPNEVAAELRDGGIATHTLIKDELAQASDVRDENSVLFRMRDLDRSKAPTVPRPSRATKSTREVAAMPDTASDLRPIGGPQSRPSAPRAARRATTGRVRKLDETTRQLEEYNPLLARENHWNETIDLDDSDDVVGIGDRTLINAPGGGYMVDAYAGSDDTYDATLVTGPSAHDIEGRSDGEGDTATGPPMGLVDDEEDAPTLSRELKAEHITGARPVAGLRSPPPALAANIQVPAVSELRKRRASRRTPPDGVTPPSALQRIVGRFPEPVPEPRPGGAAQPSSRMSLDDAATPPVYPFPPAPVPASLTHQLRLFEVDEIPSHFKIGGNARRWVPYLAAGLVAVSIAAGATFFIIRAIRDRQAIGSIHVESDPRGAAVSYDGTTFTKRTPLTIEGVPVGTRHEITVELPRHTPHVATVDIPGGGGEVSIVAKLEPISGKLIVNSQPGGAEIWIDGRFRGRTPTTISDVDMNAARHIELRLANHQLWARDLAWPDDGRIEIDAKLQR
ncbi:MAG: serine/threonine-protein kinase [Kofleriaceae bacterium]